MACLFAALVDESRHLHFAAFAAFAVEPGHLADSEMELVPVRLSQEVDLVDSDAHVAGRNFMQLGLSDVRARLVDERDRHAIAATEPVTQRGSDFEPARTAADDDDLMRSRQRRNGSSSHAMAR